MPRSARPYAPFQYYHILNRGLNRQPIFRDESDYLRFLEKLETSKTRFDWIIYSYCLLPNHYHLQVKTRHVPLSKILSSLQTSHSGYFNRKYKKLGPVFNNRFKSILVQKDPYFLQLSKYIHLNPVKANLASKPQDYPYSSYPEIISQPKHQFHTIDKRVIKSLTGSLNQQAISQYRYFVEESTKLTYHPDKSVRGIMGSTRFRIKFE